MNARPGAMLLVLLFSLVGCQSEWVSTDGPNSPTEGVSFNMLMEGKAQQLVRYRLSGDGRLWFAGGVAVANDEFTWEGSINRADGYAVASAVRDGRWFSKPPSGDGSESVTWTIKAWEPGGHASFTVYGHDPSVQKVYDILKRVSSQRFDEYIRELPKPSLDRELERKEAAEGDEGDSKGSGP